MKKTIISCDLCQSEELTRELNVPCTFTTDQTEGRSTKPYLATVELDICSMCLDRIVKNQPLYAHGAMGHNEYYWRKDA